ncbi:MATE family efflux transporter [Paenibacillus sp. 1001270B_150601_E10]|uniref:MATE family efflux transporter n=1 Tax=Paenibacillus sp. 1001270B_150601_E10 TaxID=2787079 RepID=UPI00189DC32B|nr:MATE family efflux transporter [Paenibacillus sp. 1001270B_150601_E10]
MNQTHTWKQKVKMMFHILLPIFITQVAMQFMVFFDTVMSGNFNKENLAGVAIGASLWTPIYTGVSGIFLGVTPIVAQALGARKKERIASSVIQAAYLAIVFGLVLIVVGGFAIEPILHAMSLEAEVAKVAANYLHFLGIGVIPVLIYTVMRASIDGLGQTRVTMFITLLSFPINVLLNYVFIFGKFGFPSLGGAGSGLATSITYIIIMSVAIWFMKRNDGMKELRMLSAWEKISFKKWKEVLKIGTPIGLSIFFEVSIFAMVTLLMSNYDTVTIASHQAAMNFASLLYMLPLSVAMSLTILIGFEVGAKRYKDARQYARLGIGFAIGMSSLCAILLFFLSSDVAALYNPEPSVRELTQSFLFYAIFFQLSDAIAAPIQGTLRGYKDVNIVFIIAFLSYWVIGLPSGYALAAFTSLDAYGYWIGLIVGLAIGAVGLFSRLAVIERRAKRGILADK